MVSVYPGDYDPHADYDVLKPEKTLALPSFGGVAPTPYPGGGVQVVARPHPAKGNGLYELIRLWRVRTKRHGCKWGGSAS